MHAGPRRVIIAIFLLQVHYLQKSRDVLCWYFVSWFTLFSVYAWRLSMLPVAFEAFCVPRSFPCYRMDVRPFSSNTSIYLPLMTTASAIHFPRCFWWCALSLWSTSCHTHKCLHLSVCMPMPHQAWWLELCCIFGLSWQPNASSMTKDLYFFHAGQPVSRSSKPPYQIYRIRLRLPGRRLEVLSLT